MVNFTWEPVQLWGGVVRKKLPDNAKNMNQAQSKIDSSHMLMDCSVSERREKITSDQTPNEQYPTYGKCTSQLIINFHQTSKGCATPWHFS
jgi:hypothetical protein